MQWQDWNASQRPCGDTVAGFIHTIGDTPFFCTFYLREQVSMFVERCWSADVVSFHFDATGTVVKDVNDSKLILYYTLIPDDSTMPVFKFLSLSHTTETIAYLLELFCRDVRECTNGTSLQPLYVVTDLSFAIINATLFAFNKCTLMKYLWSTMDVLECKQNL